MKFCSKCGSQIEDNLDFCPKCGAPLNEEAKAKAPVIEQAPVSSEDKIMGAISYLGILFIVPLIAKKDSEFVKFHINQGLILFVAGLLAAVLEEALDGIPVMGAVFSALFGIIGLVIFIFAIIGLVNAAKGEKYKLPIIGDIKIIK